MLKEKIDLYEDYVDEFTSYLSEWCAANGLGDVEIILGTDWAYYQYTNEVEIPLIETDDDIVRQYFWDSVLAAGLRQDIPFPYFAISFLHEVGHSHTLEFYTKEELQESRIKAAAINTSLRGMDPHTKEAEELHKKYFDLLIEKDATRWAVEFANDYPNIVWSLNYICEEFFKKIEADDEMIKILSAYYDLVV